MSRWRVSERVSEPRGRGRQGAPRGERVPGRARLARGPRADRVRSRSFYLALSQVYEQGHLAWKAGHRHVSSLMEATQNGICTSADTRAKPPRGQRERERGLEAK